MHRFTLGILGAALLMAGARAQDGCSALTVLGSGKPGTNLAIQLRHASHNAPAFLALSLKRGHTTFDFGFAKLNLGLAKPVTLVSLGKTSPQGHLSLTVRVPKVSHKITVFLQGVLVVPGRGHDRLGFCPSNVVGAHLGGTGD